MVQPARRRRDRRHGHGEHPVGSYRSPGNRCTSGTTLGGESTTGKVKYQFDQQTVWVQWPDGRRKEVKLTDELSDQRWQKLRQPGGGVGGATRQEPGGGVGGWSSEPGADAIAGTGTVTSRGQLKVAGQQVYGREDTRRRSPPRARSSTGLTSKRCGCSGPDGRRKEVKLTNELSDERWQKLRQPRGGVGGWSSQPGADAIPGQGTVTSGGQLTVAGQRVYVGKTLGGVVHRGQGRVPV